MKQLVTALFRGIPSGVGSTGKIKLNVNEEKRVLRKEKKKSKNWGEKPLP